MWLARVVFIPARWETISRRELSLDIQVLFEFERLGKRFLGDNRLNNDESLILALSPVDSFSAPRID